MDCSPPGSSVQGILQAKYWSELPFPSPGDLPDPGIKSGTTALQADTTRATGEATNIWTHLIQALLASFLFSHMTTTYLFIVLQSL